MNAVKSTVGFVGLGHMGGNMAARLLGAGYTVYGQANHKGAAQELIDAGLQWRDTPGEVAAAADVVLSSIPDDDVLQGIASGPDGVIAGLEAGEVWVDLSTVSPGASRAVAEQVREAGAKMLDAPVSGSVPQVQSGTLTIMVGGDEDAYDRVEPILSELGTPTHIGANGHGLALKLAINISLAVQMLAFAEGLLLAQRSGVDRRRALEVMESSPIGSPMLRARASIILDPPEEAWFSLGFMHKDLELALAEARDLEIPLPTAERADEVIERAAAMGDEQRDLAYLFQVLEQLANGGPAPAANPVVPSGISG
jgi:3-hydroxyisobutyrate dehydrogenase-like beta-hydroxyacid dehydrogenase